MNKWKDWLKANGWEKEVTIIQSKVASEVNRIDDYDAVISTTAVPDKIKDKIILVYLYWLEWALMKCTKL